MISHQMKKHIDALYFGKPIPDKFMEIVEGVAKCVEDANDDRVVGAFLDPSLRSTQILGLLKWMYENGHLHKHNINNKKTKGAKGEIYE